MAGVTIQELLAYLHLVAPGLSLTALVWLIGAVGLALLLLAGARGKERGR